MDEGLEGSRRLNRAEDDCEVVVVVVVLVVVV